VIRRYGLGGHHYVRSVNIGSGEVVKMPYNDHPVFQTEAEPTQPIWRYVSVPQLLSVIEMGSLWFTRSNKFDDPFEGRLPRENQKELSKSDKIKLPGFAEVEQRMGGQNRTARWEQVNEKSEIEAYRRISFINSWHQQDSELDTLWRANLQSGSGVVLKSTIGDLKKSFRLSDHRVYVGEVNYIDFKDEKIEGQNKLYPFIYKREGFSQENELRAVLTTLPHDDHPGWKGRAPGERVNLDWEAQPPGLYIDVDVETLIEEIRISPTTPAWVKRTVSDVLSKYDLEIPVNKSSLAIGVGEYPINRSDMN